jgi:two-component system response regulator DesR
VIRVPLAEDQATTRGALAALLGLAGDIEGWPKPHAGTKYCHWRRANRPDVALLDIEMPGAWTACRQPAAARAAGLQGADPDHVRTARVPAARHGERRCRLDPALVATALSEGANPLTERERDVLAASAGGASIADVAVLLQLSEGAVRN